ncbi:MAG TPA: class I SAM-dependent methyltransferase [Pyrinomonadaceae bacterium]|jgi:SAM-dependent methyltransferase|nr:class I SAM-dependent methyltransferase [Pyrinomonadaceae bacterium]
MKAEDYADLYALEQEFWWFEGMREITAALLDAACAPAESRLVLDAGCGTGGNLSWLARYAGSGRVMGVDLSPDALRFCAEREHRGLAQASVADLPFADSTFDLVTSFDVLVQLPGEASDERAMREMCRVLRPGGVAFVRVAAYRWMRSGHDRALDTQRRYTLGELVGKMERAGFDARRATYANSFLLPVAAFRRLLLKRAGLADRGSDVKPLPPSLRWLNQALEKVLRGEASILRGPRRRLPFGLSAICVAQKPGG